MMDINVPDKDEFQEFSPGKTIIKVVGCGGCGCNTITRLFDNGIKGVDLIAVNTDVHSLAMTKANLKIAIGNNVGKGLGVGGKPEVGRTAAEESESEIKNIIEGANLVFIAAGMGGGTGTGAAPVVARIAREMGILTIAVVTLPFHFEGALKLEIAKRGLEEVYSHAHKVIEISNAKLLEKMGMPKDLSSAFQFADNVLNNGILGITDIITNVGNLNVDFNDVRTIMELEGGILLGMGNAEGKNRGIAAAEATVNHPLLDGLSIQGAQGLLYIVNSSNTLSFEEFNEIGEFFHRLVSEKAHIKFGWNVSSEMGDKVSIIVVATGFNKPIRIPPDSGGKTTSVSSVSGSTVVSSQEWKDMQKGLNVRSSVPPIREFNPAENISDKRGEELHIPAWKRRNGQY